MKGLSFKWKTMCLSLMGRGAQTLLGRTKRKQPANADCFWQGRRDYPDSAKLHINRQKSPKNA